MGGALTEADSAAVREVFEAVVTAQNAGDWDAVQSQLTSDVVGLDPRLNGAIRGAGAWREFAESLGLSDVDLEFTIEDVSGAGDIAYVVWAGGGTWTEGGEEVHTSAKGVNLFRRDSDGSWLMSHYCWNANP